MSDDAGGGGSVGRHGFRCLIGCGVAFRGWWGSRFTGWGSDDLRSAEQRLVARTVCLPPASLGTVNKPSAGGENRAVALEGSRDLRDLGITAAHPNQMDRVVGVDCAIQKLPEARGCLRGPRDDHAMVTGTQHQAVAQGSNPQASRPGTQAGRALPRSAGHGSAHRRRRRRSRSRASRPTALPTAPPDHTSRPTAPEDGPHNTGSNVPWSVLDGPRPRRT